MRPTKGATSSLLLPEGPIAASDKASPLTDCDDPPCNRQRLQSIRQNGKVKCFLRSHLSSSLHEDTPSYSFTYFSLTLLAFPTFPFLILGPTDLRAPHRPLAAQDVLSCWLICMSRTGSGLRNDEAPIVDLTIVIADASPSAARAFPDPYSTNKPPSNISSAQWRSYVEPATRQRMCRRDSFAAVSIILGRGFC